MTVFKLLWCIDAIAALIIFWFFIKGLNDGSVSSFNIKLWLLILVAVGTILVTSILLKQQGYHKAAIGTTLILAVPALIYGLFILVVITNKGKWN